MDVEELLIAAETRAQGTPWYSEFLVLESRLKRNVSDERRYGGAESTRRERAEIVDALNELFLSKLGIAFTRIDLAGSDLGPMENQRTVSNAQLNVKSIARLAELITTEPDYRKGYQLVEFFNDLGFDDVYGAGFPSRFTYVKDRLTDANGTEIVSRAILKLFAPIEYIGRYDKLDKLIADFNEYLGYDGYMIVREERIVTLSPLPANPQSAGAGTARERAAERRPEENRLLETGPRIVFISYAHENDDHSGRVLSLSSKLLENGVDVRLDQYDPYPKDGWIIWMNQNIETADFVLMICSPAYYRRVTRRERAGEGLGVQWEGNLIYNRLYENLSQADKYIPVLLPGSSVQDIPDPVRSFPRYTIAVSEFSDSGFESLYRHLTKQPAIMRPQIGSIRSLPPRR